MKFWAGVERFRKDRSGATAMEYGLITALLSVVMIVALTAVGVELDSAFTFIGDTLRNA